MTNKQLAAARRIMSQFQNLRIDKEGEVLTPYRDGVRGTPVTVTEAMSTSEVESLLRTSCLAING